MVWRIGMRRERNVRGLADAVVEQVFRLLFAKLEDDLVSTRKTSHHDELAPKAARIWDMFCWSAMVTEGG